MCVCEILQDRCRGWRQENSVLLDFANNVSLSASDLSLAERDAQRLRHTPHWIPICFMVQSGDSMWVSGVCEHHHSAFGDLQVKGKSKLNSLFHDLLMEEAIKG